MGHHPSMPTSKVATMHDAIAALVLDGDLVAIERFTHLTCHAEGNTQMWGLMGCQKEAAFAADRVIVVVEEPVATEVVRADPDRTLIPGLIVDAVVVEPLGGLPSSTHGYHGRDRHFSTEWDAISRERTTLDAWLVEWVHGLPDRAAYMDRLGPCVAARMRPTGTAPSGSTDQGMYE
jgi:glutaconate CoA-transferase subunit A